MCSSTLLSSKRIGLRLITLRNLLPIKRILQTDPPMESVYWRMTSPYTYIRLQEYHANTCRHTDSSLPTRHHGRSLIEFSARHFVISNELYCYHLPTLKRYREIPNGSYLFTGHDTLTVRTFSIKPIIRWRLCILISSLAIQYEAPIMHKVPTPLHSYIPSDTKDLCWG